MVLLQVASIWLFLQATLIYGQPTENKGTNSSYDPIANTFTIMSNITSDSFNCSWTAYRDGFQTGRGNYWHGLEKLHRLTNDGNDYQLMILLTDPETASVTYSSCNEFKVDSEQQDYRVHCRPLPGYVQEFLDGSNFSTYDRGSRKEQAAALGFGWWFGSDQSKPHSVSIIMLTKLQKNSSN